MQTFIFSSPKEESNSRGLPLALSEIRVDLSRVLLPMLVVICATIAGAWLTREKPTQP